MRHSARTAERETTSPFDVSIARRRKGFDLVIGVGRLFSVFRGRVELSDCDSRVGHRSPEGFVGNAGRKSCQPPSSRSPRAACGQGARARFADVSGRSDSLRAPRSPQPGVFCIWHTVGVAWEVEFTDEFRDWWDALSEERQDDVAHSVRHLIEFGTALSFPHSSKVGSSRYPQTARPSS
jgi:hypothetical protein